MIKETWENDTLSDGQDAIDNLVYSHFSKVMEVETSLLS